MKRTYEELMEIAKQRVEEMLAAPHHIASQTKSLEAIACLLLAQEIRPMPEIQPLPMFNLPSPWGKGDGKP